MTTIEQLQAVIPGQSDAWYRRIAAEIDEGRMPMPSLEAPKDTTYSYSKSDLNPVHRTEVLKTPHQSPRYTAKTGRANPQKSPKPSKRLVELCNGNQATAERLLASIMEKNPGKTGKWADEKAVWDLERDRGSH
ncbi:MAG: hypothetical protein ACRC62_25995 [Microcoleus sp.]